MINKNAIIYKGATICDKDQMVRKDIKIENFGHLGINDFKIVEISDNIIAREGERVINALNSYIMPKIVDLNIRVKNDTLNVDHIQRLAHKANSSGIGSFAIMPDCNPSVDNETTVEMIQLQKEYTKTPIIPICNSITKEGKLSNIASMIDLGCQAIYLHSKCDSNLIYRVSQYSTMKKVPLICRCENESLSSSGVMNESRVSSELGLVGIDKLAETSEVARVLQIVKSINAKTLFQSISTSCGLEIIDQAKKRGADIYSEVSIHHLVLNDTACYDYNTSAKINPPLREDEEREKLIQALKDGKIDTLTSLHAQKSVTRKDLPFAEADYGIDNLEFYFALCYTKLVKSGIISMQKLSELLSYNPAKIMGLENSGLIKEGYSADFMIIDLNKELEVLNNSPYKGEKLYGKKVN
jgi:dihydroorotase